MKSPSGLTAPLAAIIDSYPDWWRFPDDGVVRGFLGTDPLFIVGDQPSTSSWTPKNKHRQAFYSLLARLGAGNAHLTDLYKRRGPAGSLKYGLPDDFELHVDFFREELAILRPERVVALGDVAHDLIAIHIPEVSPILTKMLHFAHVIRWKRPKHEWEENARRALFGNINTPPVPIARITKIKSETTSLGSATPHPSGLQREFMTWLFAEHSQNIEQTITAYAEAERSGKVRRNSNSANLTPERYARTLLQDGLRKGWLNR